MLSTSVVEHWLALPREMLLDKVRQVVKRRDSEAKEIWAAVKGHSVLAARVRGALSSLRADVRGSRDEVMWSVWIEQARQALDSAETAAPCAVTPGCAAVPAPQRDSSVDELRPERAEPELPLVPQPKRPRSVSAVPPVLFKAPGN